MKLAFTVEDTFGVKKQKNDPRYVKWFVRISGYIDGKAFQRMYPYHKCTDEDYNSFYPVEKSSRVLL